MRLDIIALASDIASDTQGSATTEGGLTDGLEEVRSRCEHLSMVMADIGTGDQHEECCVLKACVDLAEAGAELRQPRSMADISTAHACVDDPRSRLLRSGSAAPSAQARVHS